MKMLCWICGKTSRVKIINYNIIESGIKPIIEKNMKTRFRWFEHVQRILINFILRKIDLVRDIQTIRNR